MRLPEFESDLAATTRRCNKLQEYFEEQVLVDGEFICAAQQACKESHPGTFHEGQLHHVGTHYDLRRNGAPFRIMVVGQEYGHGPPHVSLETRRTNIETISGTGSRFAAVSRSAEEPIRNPHMRGCTNILRLLFGKSLGADFDGEFIELNSEAVHLFKCFALVNFLLCSAVPTEAASTESIGRGGKKGQSTRTMRRNCARHFRRTIEILQPTLIVAQGHGVSKWINSAFDKPSDSNLEQVVIDGRKVEVMLFSHPSAQGNLNWGRNDQTPYLVNDIARRVSRFIEERDREA